MVLRGRKESRSNWAGCWPGGPAREGREKCNLSAKRAGIVWYCDGVNAASSGPEFAVC